MQNRDQTSGSGPTQRRTKPVTDLEARLRLEEQRKGLKRLGASSARSVAPVTLKLNPSKSSSSETPKPALLPRTVNPVSKEAPKQVVKPVTTPTTKPTTTTPSLKLAPKPGQASITTQAKLVAKPATKAVAKLVARPAAKPGLGVKPVTKSPTARSPPKPSPVPDELDFLDNVSLRKDKSSKSPQAAPVTRPGSAERPTSDSKLVSVGQKKLLPTTKSPNTTPAKTGNGTSSMTTGTTPKTTITLKVAPSATKPTTATTSPTQPRTVSPTTTPSTTSPKPVIKATLPTPPPPKSKPATPEEEFLDEIIHTDTEAARQRKLKNTTPPPQFVPTKITIPISQPRPTTTTTATTTTATTKAATTKTTGVKRKSTGSIESKVPAAKRPRTNSTTGVVSKQTPTTTAQATKPVMKSTSASAARPLTTKSVSRPPQQPPSWQGYDLDDDFIDNSYGAEIDSAAFGGFLKGLGFYRGPTSIQSYRELGGGDDDDWEDFEDIYDNDGECGESGFEQLRREESRTLIEGQKQDKIERMREKKGDAAAEALRRQLYPKKASPAASGRGGASSGFSSAPRKNVPSAGATKKPVGRAKAVATPSLPPPITKVRRVEPKKPTEKPISSIDDLF